MGNRSVTSVTSVMDRLGFRESFRGTAYIREAVGMAMRDRDVMMSKDIYPAIAAAAGRSPAAIERAMRTAIQGAMKAPQWDAEWREIGGWGTPTNGEIVRRIARECRED